MFRRDAFVLIAAAVVASVMAVYASLADTPFFPASLQTTLGECPDSRYIPAHRRPVLEPDEVSWFGHQLRALHEEPLAQGGAGRRPTLRFTLLSGGMIATVRVTETEAGRLHLTGKWLQPCTGERGCVVEKLLSPAEQARLEAAVEPLLRVPSYGCYGPPDSANSILEVSDGDTYRLWHERSGPRGNTAAAGEILLHLAEWPLAHEIRTPASHP